MIHYIRWGGEYYTECGRQIKTEHNDWVSIPSTTNIIENVTCNICSIKVKRKYWGLQTPESIKGKYAHIDTSADEFARRRGD